MGHLFTGKGWGKGVNEITSQVTPGTGGEDGGSVEQVSCGGGLCLGEMNEARNQWTEVRNLLNKLNAKGHYLEGSGSNQ